MIVGAGLAGLTAGRILSSAGLQAPILEAQGIAGGRLATLVEPLPGGRSATFDHGAQFITVRDQDFGNQVQSWLEAGLISEWSRGFATADGSYYADGHPRYRASGGMASLAARLAGGLDVRLNQPVTEITIRDGVWQLLTSDGRQQRAEALIVTVPPPQALSLFDPQSGLLPGHVRRALNQITYEPCIAVMIQLDAASHLPEPGGMWPVGEPLSWIADNYRKGISAAPGAVTLHAGPEFSQSFWEADDEEIVNELTAAAQDWLGSDIRSSHVRRWRYSKPLRTHLERCISCPKPAQLIFAGDAFAGPRVEGAYLSGSAAAGAILT